MKYFALLFALLLASLFLYPIGLIFQKGESCSSLLGNGDS